MELNAQAWTRHKYFPTGVGVPMILAGAYLLARAYSGASENETGSERALPARGPGSTAI